MKVTVTRTPLSGLVMLDIDYFIDARGFFIEPWNKRDFSKAGLEIEFVQEGHSRSQKNVLRGLHYQNLQAPMGKLIRCTVGKIFDVAVDLRTQSPTCSKWFGIELSAKNKRLIYVPVGFAHGFLTLSSYAEIQYKQTGYYTPSSEGTISWNDPDMNILWPLHTSPILSIRDQHGMSLQEYLQNPAFS